jgi:hypothetical protein
VRRKHDQEFYPSFIYKVRILWFFVYLLYEILLFTPEPKWRDFLLCMDRFWKKLLEDVQLFRVTTVVPFLLSESR